MEAKTRFLSVSAIIAKSIFASVVMVTTIFLGLGIYFLGYLKGYIGSYNAISNYLSEVANEQSSSISYTLKEPTPSIYVDNKRNDSYARNVSWGGPDLWEAVNKRRVQLGVNPLETASELCTIASIRLNQLLELGKLDGHVGFSNMPQDRPDLKWIFEKYSSISEFLAVGGATPEETVGLWENTLGHRKLLDGGEYVWGCIYSQNSFAVAITAF